MSNRAGIVCNVDGVPTQENMDAFIASLDTPEHLEIDATNEELEKYREDMLAAIEARDREAYDEARAKFDEAKKGLLDKVKEATKEVQERVNEWTSGISDWFTKQIPDAVKKICDVDLVKGTITPKVPESIDEVLTFLEDVVLAIVYPYKPIIKIIKWWIVDCIPKMTVYVGTRVSELADVQVSVSSNEAPEYPEE